MGRMVEMVLSVADQSPTMRTVFATSAATGVLLSSVAVSDLATNVDSK